jgi:hypothetical protein
MSDVDAYREYAKFHAARQIVLDPTSATDFHPIGLGQSLDEGGTDPLETWHVHGQQRRLRPWIPSIAQDVSSTGNLAYVVLVSDLDNPTHFTGMGDFAALDDSRTPEGQIRRQIHSLRRGFQLKYCERLARRLEFLLEAMEEEEKGWTEDSPESLRRMLLFLNNVPSFRYPVVTITPSATFRAQWTADEKRHFAIDFLPSGEVRFVVFSPDPRHPNRIQRISGIMSWENLINVIETYRVHHWAADARA